MSQIAVKLNMCVYAPTPHTATHMSNVYSYIHETS